MNSQFSLEDFLRRLPAFRNSILEALEDLTIPACLTNEKQEMLFTNSALCDLLSYDEHELHHQPLDLLLHHEDHDKHRHVHEDVGSRQSEWLGMLRFLDRQGGARPMQVRQVPWVSEAGRSKRITFLLGEAGQQDQTERVRVVQK